MGADMNEIAPIKPINLFQALNKLASDADHIAERQAWLENLRRMVRQQKAALENGEVVGEIIDGKRAALSKYDKAVLARCHELRDLVDASENYEDDEREEGTLRRNIVSVRLASLIGAFPNGAPGDPEVYTRLLLEHVCAVEGLNLLALDATCREIVATKKFVPTVSEVIEVLGEQLEKWWERLRAISWIAGTSREAMAEIEALQKAAKERAVQQAQRDLDRALHQRSKAIAELAQCEARVLDAERALSEAVKSADSSGEVRP